MLLSKVYNSDDDLTEIYIRYHDTVAQVAQISHCLYCNVYMQASITMCMTARHKSVVTMTQQ
jgi:hypothetical protein